MACVCCQELIHQDQPTTLFKCGHILCNSCAPDLTGAVECIECGNPEIFQPDPSRVDPNIAKLRDVQDKGANYLEHILDQHARLKKIKIDLPGFDKFLAAIAKSYAADYDALSTLLSALQSAVDNYKLSLTMSHLRGRYLDTIEEICWHWQDRIEQHAPKFKPEYLNDIYLFDISSETKSSYVLVFCGFTRDQVNMLVDEIKVFPLDTQKILESEDDPRLKEPDGQLATRICREIWFQRGNVCTHCILYWGDKEKSRRVFLLGGWKIKQRTSILDCY